MPADYALFQNRPVIILTMYENDKYPVMLGVRKAKKVLAHVKELQEFVTKYDCPTPREENFAKFEARKAEREAQAQTQAEDKPLEF